MDAEVIRHHTVGPIGFVLHLNHSTRVRFGPGPLDWVDVEPGKYSFTGHLSAESLRCARVVY